MSISIHCYSQAPFVGAQTKAELKAKLKAPISTVKARINASETPSLSIKTLEIFRWLGSPAPTAINSCALNITKYDKYKADEKSDPSLIEKILFVALMSFFVAPLMLAPFLLLELSMTGIITTCLTIAGLLSYDAATRWSKAVLEKTKAKYVARADFKENYKFSIGSDQLRLALEKKISTNEDEIQQAKKNLAAPPFSWERFVAYIKQPKIYPADELKTALSELKKVNAFYNQFNPVLEKEYTDSKLKDLFQQMGTPVPNRILKFNLKDRMREIVELESKIPEAEKKHMELKYGGMVMMAATVSLVALGVITTPATFFGWLAIGAVSTSLGFTTPSEKRTLEEYQNLLKKDQQEIEKFLSEGYPTLKEKLIEEITVHPHTPHESMLLHQALNYLEMFKRQCEPTEELKKPSKPKSVMFTARIRPPAAEITIS